MGAWIEIVNADSGQDTSTSLPLWERGLKSYVVSFALECVLSLPLWERGLKYQIKKGTPLRDVSLPLWERGLK